MGSTENCYLLQQDDFKSNIVGSLQTLRNAGDFFDVTLACADKTTIEAHKVVLSAFSPFLKHVLTMSKQSHPFIYLKGILKQDLEAIVEYLYSGETKVPVDDVNRFLEAATELEIAGLINDENTMENTQDVNITDLEKVATLSENDESFQFESPPDDSKRKKRKPKSLKSKEAIVKVKEEKIVAEENADDNSTANESNSEADESGSTTTLDLSSMNDEEKMEKLMYEISQKMEKVRSDTGGTVWQCKDCGRIGKQKDKLGMHVETHLTGYTHNCKFCERTYQTRNSLLVHKYTAHKDRKE